MASGILNSGVGDPPPPPPPDDITETIKDSVGK